MESTTPKIVGPYDGKAGFLGSIGVRFMIDGNEAGDRFSLVEHQMSPRALAAPIHRHAREDEYSCVLEGSVGALLGDAVVIGNPGIHQGAVIIGGGRHLRGWGECRGRPLRLWFL